MAALEGADQPVKDERRNNIGLANPPLKSQRRGFASNIGL
jgi:hypothetical protein